MKWFMKWLQNDKIVTTRINNCKQVGSAITNQMTPDSQKHSTFNFATNPENTIWTKTWKTQNYFQTCHEEYERWQMQWLVGIGSHSLNE